MDVVGVGSSSQLIVVMTPSWSDIHGTIEAWEKDTAGTWTQVMAPSNANIGLNGWVRASERIQGDHKTPAGIFGIHMGFGYNANPGTTLPYAHLLPSYYWAGDQRDPKTYNVLQTSHPATAIWRTSESEALYYTRPAYEYVASDRLQPGRRRPSAERPPVRRDHPGQRPARERHLPALLRHHGPARLHARLRQHQHHADDLAAPLAAPAASPKIVMGPAPLIRTF